MFIQISTTPSRAGRLVGLMTCVLVLAVAPPALAQTCDAPPGTSAIEQYCEAVPGPGGDRGIGEPDRGGYAVSTRTRQALERQGRDGRGVLQLTPGTRRPAERGEAPDSEEPAGNPLTAVQDAVADGSVPGRELGLALLAVALGIGGAAWFRFRRGAAQS